MSHNFARPTLGFETKKEAIRHLHGQGMPVATIAHEIGSNTKTVSVVLSSLRLKPHKAPTWRPSLQVSSVVLSKDVIWGLRPHAARRGLTCAALAALIVDTVVEHGLVDGVLDDREG